MTSLVVLTLIPVLGVPPQPPREIPLRYEEALTAIGFPNPLLRGRVRGESVWFIVDTGAGVHTFASWLVKAAHVPSADTRSTTTGSTGVEQRVRAVQNEAIALERGDRVTLREAIVADFPPLFEQQRIGGLVSPQLLAPPGFVAVLDLRAPALSFRRDGDRSASLGGRACVNRGSPFTNRLYALPMSASGIGGEMLVDTGATATVAAPSSRIGSQLADRAVAGGTTQGVGGGATTTRKVPDVVVDVGDARTTVSLVIGGSTPTCGVDGLLGMDVLRHCVLDLGTTAIGARCGDGGR